MEAVELGGGLGQLKMVVVEQEVEPMWMAGRRTSGVRCSVKAGSW